MGGKFEIVKVMAKPRWYLGTKSQFLLFLSILSSVFFYSGNFHSYLSGRALVKTISISCLTGIVLLHYKSRQEVFLLLALIFHTLGDIIICFDLIIHSMGPFFLGHVFFIITFICDLPTNLTHHIMNNISRWKAGICGIVLLWAVGLGALIVPVLASIAEIIVIYMVTITAVVVASLIPTYKYRWMTVGCLLYVLSDSIIALTEFYFKNPAFGALFSWPTYYLGQSLIVMGMLQEKGHFTHFTRHDFSSPLAWAHEVVVPSLR